MAKNSYEVFTEVASTSEESCAISTPGKEDTSFGELFRRNELMREQLAQLGVIRGTRIGILASSRDLMATAHLAVICLATSAPLSAQTLPSELEFAVGDFNLDAVIIEEAMTVLISRASDLGVKLITLAPFSNKAGFFTLNGDRVSEPVPPVNPEPDDISVLLHTSGTTSRPKIVQRTQQWQVSALVQDDGERQVGPGDKIINVLPLHHTEGLNFQFLVPLLRGSHVILANFDPNTFIDLVEKYQPSKFTLVPAMHQIVLDAVKARKKSHDFNSLRYIESSSAKLPADTRDQLEEIFGVPVIEAYGATEAGALAVMGLDQKELPRGSVGKRAHEGIVVMDNDGQVLPFGTRGEICVKGPNVIDGFENNLEANAELFRDGWYRTGDEGYLDENDYLFVTGRLTESIGRGGEQISPLEIDVALMRHPGVAQAAAFGVVDPQLGHEVWAVVVPEEGINIDPKEIRAFVSRTLSFPKTPKKIIMVDNLPLNELGKLTRKTLSETYRRR